MSKTKVPLQLAEGPIHGYKEVNDDGTFYHFKGIPYGQPPIGVLRFMPPKPIQPWTTEKDCTQDGPQQPSLRLDRDDTGAEDCLYLKVSSPCLKPDKPLPVMFWLGSFVYTGSVDEILDESLLLTNNIVFVRCNFRLGPFGFLSLGDHQAMGNAGLKDIVLSLKWVQRNISAFGGDPNNVTICGHSTGAVLTHLLVLSPMASGLFHKAIIQSISALSNWALHKNPLRQVKMLVQEMGFQYTSVDEAADILKSAPTDAIMQAATRCMLRFRSTGLQADIFEGFFKPCVEVEFEGQPAFLTKSPDLILKTGAYNKVPIIFGSTYMEGDLLSHVTDGFYSNYKELNENTGLLVPKSLSSQMSAKSYIGKQLMEFYMGDSITEHTKTQYMQLLGDYYFMYKLNKSVSLHVQTAPECPVYYFVLNHASDWNVPKEHSLLNSLGHMSGLPYVFRINIDGAICKGGRDSVMLRSKFLRLINNFMHLGNPTPNEDPLLRITWDPVESKDCLNYLSLAPNLTKGRDPFHDRMLFWDQMHDEHVFLRALTLFSELGVVM